MERIIEKQVSNDFASTLLIVIVASDNDDMLLCNWQQSSMKSI